MKTMRMVCTAVVVAGMTSGALAQSQTPPPACSHAESGG